MHAMRQKNYQPSVPGDRAQGTWICVRGVIGVVRVGSIAARERCSIADRRVHCAQVYLDDQRDDPLWTGERTPGSPPEQIE